MRRRRVTALFSATIIGVPLALTGAGATAAERDELHLPGLNGEATIAVDSAGIPHITADDNEDLFYAQGVNAARDRLFQIDLHRRQGLGELSEVLGPDFVERDRAARLFLYRGDMDQEWDSYGPESRTAAARFAEGINAYVDWLAEHPEHMPPEFDELGYDPAHWEPEDVVRIRTHTLGTNLASELTRTQVACDDELGNADLLLGMEPEHTASLPEGLDPCTVPDDVLDTYRLATGDVSFDDQGEARLPMTAEEEEPLTTNGDEGSNSWTVSPELTDTDRPILAGDPHRPVTAPSLRYVVHLTSPEVDVVGAGEPFLPGVAMGHNGTAAYGLTFLAADQQDLVFYDVDPENPTRYRHDGAWEKMDVVTEEVALPDGSTEEVELRFTRHGPVVAQDEESDTAYAVRTTWTEPGTTAYFNSLELMYAEDFGEFRSVLDGWGGPPMNYTYADVHGDIGWSAAGLIPERGEGDGLLPVPGDGTHEWDGFMDDLPSVHNPDEGFFSTANEYNMPEDLGLGYEWAPGYRQDRVTEVLGGDGPATMEGSAELQNDVVDLTVREALPLLEGLDTEGAAREAADLLEGWDGDHPVDSAQAALYQTWFHRHLGPAFYEAVSPELASFTEHTQDAGALLDALHHPEEWIDGDAEAVRDEVLADSLAAALEDVSGSLGTDPSQWRWGDLQHTVFESPVGDDLGPFERQGSTHTVNRSGMDPAEYRHNAGASFRMVLDVGEWDSSLAINAPGQSGDPDSPHYGDHVDPWREGDYVPLHYSDDAVEADTQHTVALIPQG